MLRYVSQHTTDDILVCGVARLDLGPTLGRVGEGRWRRVSPTVLCEMGCELCALFLILCRATIMASKMSVFV